MDHLWTAELNQIVSQPPIIIGDVLLVATQPSGPMAQHGVVTAVSLSDGSTRWQHTLEYSLISGLRAHHWQGQAVAFITGSSSDFLKGKGNLLALNVAGEQVWRWENNAEHFSAPFLLNDTIVVAIGDKTLAVIEPDGTERLFPLSVQASLSAPAVYGDVAYIPCRSGDLLAVGLDGIERWHFQAEGDKRNWLDKTPAIAGINLIATSSLGMVYVLAAASGKLEWQEALGEGHELSQPGVQGEMVYVGHKHGLVAMDIHNGRSQWKFLTERPIVSTPLLVGDTILVTGEDHNLYALNREDGTEQWRHELPHRIEMAPVLAETAVLVADQGGTIVALERPSNLISVPEPEPEAVVDPAILRQQQRETAVQYEQDQQHLEAAKLWHDLGELEHAAQQYELAQAWREAAKLWRQLDRYGKRADALKHHAEQLRMSQATDEEKAAAWAEAARIYSEMGEKVLRDACEHEVARYRRLPILNIEIEPEEMIQNAWSKVGFIAKNEGFGTAHYLTVQLKDDRFEGQMAATQTMITLAVGRDYKGHLDVRPRHQGSSVPMQINIEYMDNAGLQVAEQTFYLPVAGEVTQIVTGPFGTGALGATGSREALAQLPTPEGVNLFEFYNKLKLNYERDELWEVIFELGLNQDDFSERLSMMARELITALARHGRIEELIAICERDRGHVVWRE